MKAADVWVVFLLAFCSLSVRAFAEATNEFRTINVTHGLSHNMINSIFKDKRGFVWVGTQTGLDRFDGMDVKTYPAFKGQSVFDVCETSPIELWVGTDQGLWRLDRRSGVVERFFPEVPALTVRALYSTAEDGLLIATNKGLFLRKEKQVRKVLFDKNVLSQTNSLTKIVADKEKHCYWITSYQGLIHYNALSGKSIVYAYSDKDDALNSYSCLLLQRNYLYVGTKNRGLIRLDTATRTFSSLPDIGCAYITTLSLANDHTLYVGTNGGGVKIVSIPTGQVISSIEHSGKVGSISSNAVYSFLKDGEATWIGTYMGGLNYTPTRGNVFSVYSSPLFNSANHNVRSFWIGEDGVKVIGTRDGLFFISERNNEVKSYSTTNSVLRSDIVLAVFPFQHECLIGTYGGGLYRLNLQTGALAFFAEDENFKSGSFNAFVLDKHGNLWMGTSKGAYVYHTKDGQYTVYNHQNSALEPNSIFSVKADSKDRIWFGTSGALQMYNPATKTFHSDMFPEKIKAVTRSVRYIYEDSHSFLWFCDDKEGVVKVDEYFTEFTHLTAEDYLPNNSVMSLIEDEENGMWFSTQRGLLYRRGNSNTYFSLYDGIPSYIFNYPVQRDEEGTLWWGNEQGLVSYSKQAQRAEQSWGAPVITNVAVDGRTLVPGEEWMPYAAEFLEEIHVPASAHTIEFAFSVLNYPVEHSDMYEFCLEGFDKGWQRLVDNNKVTYANLPVGDYVFKVKSSSNPNEVMVVKVLVNRNFTFTGSLVAFCGIVCCLLLWRYARLWRKYRLIKAYSVSESEGYEKRLPAKEKYSRSKIESYEVQIIQRNLLEYVQREKPYLSPDLKLSDLAKAIGCTAGELSQVLNQHLATNFPDFINKYRVEEFILRVQDEVAARYTLTSLSEQCGFSSRTSFFRSFKKQKGKTPAEYIKEMGVTLER